MILIAASRINHGAAIRKPNYYAGELFPVLYEGAGLAFLNRGE